MKKCVADDLRGPKSSTVNVVHKITSSRPSEGFLKEKLGIFSKVKIFQNSFCFKLEIINKNYHKK